MQNCNAAQITMTTVIKELKMVRADKPHGMVYKLFPIARNEVMQNKRIEVMQNKRITL